jgi:hypothetical protein
MFRPILCFALLIVMSFAVGVRADDDENDKHESTVAKQPSQEELEQQFADKLTGAVLEGSFTADDAPAAEAPKPDRYQLGTVKKGKNGYFLIAAKVQYDGRDTEFKMPVQVKWAGDTPVITLTKVLIPGFGTFTARVLFYEDRYAGTWQGGDHGGTMFGRILHGAEAKEPSAGDSADAQTTDDSDDN